MAYIYMYISIIFLMLLMILTARMLYGEAGFTHRKSWIIYGILFILSLSGTLFIKPPARDGFMILALFSFFSGMIALTRRKKRIRGMFLLFPILGILMSIDMIPLMILNIFLGGRIDFLGSDFSLYECIYDCIVYSILCLILIRKLPGRRMAPGVWERRILNGNGILLFVIYCFSISIPDTLSKYEHYFLFGLVIIAIMIIGTSTIMTMQSARACQYQLQAEIGEHYLKSQLEHFRAYQNTQKETQRIRHDMKNHMLALWDLYERSEYEALGTYLQELKDVTSQIDKVYHTGNDMADAIINEKFSGTQDTCSLLVEGSMARTETIAPIDICTIFANALDNCLEAFSLLPLAKPVISISIKRNNRILLICFTNPCAETCQLTDGLPITGKKDVQRHGFGLANIKKAAEKYNGNIEISVARDDSGQKQFILSVLLIL